MLDEKVVQELMKQEWKERTSSWGKNYFIEAGDYSVELKQGEIPGTIIQQMERKNWMRFKKKISNILTD